MLRGNRLGQGLWLSLGLVLAPACSPGEPEPVHDAQVSEPERDAGTQHDAATGADASAGRDAAPHDPRDAQVAPSDAGPADAGLPPPPVLVGYTGSGAHRGGSAGAKLNIGHQFEVTRDGIVLRDLGVWDEGADGLHAAHTVTLFSLDELGNDAQATPVPGGSVQVPAGSDAPLADGFRFAALPTPLALAQGSYAVIAYGLDGDDPYGDGGNLPLSTTGVRHGAFAPYQFVEAASPAYPTGGDGNPLCSASFRYQSPRAPMLRILPLGDSITWGWASSNAGYRTTLRGLLEAAGVEFQYVGTASDFPGDLPQDQRHHEGHPGWVITRGSSGRDGLTDHLPMWLGPSGVTPDVVLLMIGTNDVDLDYDLGHAKERLETLVSMITGSGGLAPQARLLLAQVTRVVDAEHDALDPVKDARAVSYNQGVAELVAEHRARGESVQLVDMHSALEPADFADWVHPNDTGYQKMAHAWFDAIMAP
jgi:lysophospholipase L1-like esterase